MNMKKFLSFAGILSLIMFCSCEKESVEEAVNYPDPSSPENIDVYYEKLYEPMEFCEFIGNSFSDYIDAYFNKSANLIFQTMATAAFTANRSNVDKQVAEEKGVLPIIASTMWKVKIINYSYWSVGYDGQPIKLSASMCVPVLSNANVSHTLSGISMCPPHRSNDNSFCPTKAGTIMMARVAFNHAVVVPDYEGRGITSKRAFTELQTVAQARQLIDATLAGLTILKNQGYVQGPDFGLYNIGVSQGGDASYAAQKIIENDITPEQEAKLNLKETFSANGILNHSAFLDEQLADLTYQSDEQIGGYFMIFEAYFKSLPESERGGFRPEDIYSHDLINEYGRVIMDHPMLQAIRKALAKNDIHYNWNPQHPLVIESSNDDTNIPQEHHGKYVYDLLIRRPDGSWNKNVELHTFSTPIAALASDYIGPEYMFTHMMADFVSFERAISNLSFYNNK